jgi:hypothetical protein
MNAKQQSYERAEELYCLAFLFTGDRELSVRLVLEAIDLQQPGEVPFETGLTPSLRKEFIAKALTEIREELFVSATRLASRQKQEGLPPVGRSLNAGTTKAQMQNVLLAMDVFPRCALLLMAFERLNLADASVLLGSNPDLVLKGRTTALRNLTRGLARMQDWHPPTQNTRIDREQQYAF